MNVESELHDVSHITGQAIGTEEEGFLLDQELVVCSCLTKPGILSCNQPCDSRK